MRYFLLFLLFTLPILATAQTHGDEVLKDVDDLPLWPGTDTKQESDRQMLNYVYEQVTYPKEAKEAGAEGMVVISFVVYKDGTVSQLELRRDPGHGLGVEGMRLATKMARDIRGWTPGMEKGEPVNTQYHLPIMFRLTDDKDKG